MKEHPILFSAPMVRAILEGRKTQTRRVVRAGYRSIYDGKVTPADHDDDLFRDDLGRMCKWVSSNHDFEFIRCPYGQPGDRLWVRETWAVNPYTPEVRYRATDELFDTNEYGPLTWRPSIHMPRALSRILLEVTAVRVERLNDISEADAKAEGAIYHDGRGTGHSGWRHDYKDVHANARSSFARLWKEINGPGSWAANPWVWVVSFRRVTR